ncbi:MAG: class I SAM-dependent methyltransferase [Chloroflexi bacterium]|nr:class I SAM-dependent methyltransferase [Chloroflexota bacterium]
MNWRDVWQRKHRERAGGSLEGKPKPEYWDKVAEDFSAWNKSNDYEYGRRAIEAIREIIAPHFEALDIGAGVGTLAIALARVVRKTTAIEPSKGMIEQLMKNAKEKGIKNIEVINKSWQQVDDATIRKRFDVVACSHLLWQFEDVDKQLERMEHASKGYCCVVHPAGGRDAILKSLWPEVVGREYGGELDPDLDDLVFVMLRQRGMLVNVKVIEFTVRLSVEQEVRHVARLLGKHAEITPALGGAIRKGVLEKSRDGMYETESQAAVIWWKAPGL